MKYVLIPVLTIIACMGVACEKNNEDTMFIFSENLLIGNWTNGEMVDTLWQYKRVNSLPENTYGFSFQSQERYVERKNAGFCGTPPITYENFNGSWSINDSIIAITVDYWGGTLDYKWKLISLDRDHLVIDRQDELTTVRPD